MKRLDLILSFLLSALCGFTQAAEPSKPNILLIPADDLGYGDVQCYNPERGKIPTPHIDRLAKQGMKFTDAHTSSGVCSPTRYALLTGRYHWRSRLQTGIVGYLEEPLIAPDRLTLVGLLKQHGYRTACIGKWHLGWDWSLSADERKMLKAYGGKAGGGYGGTVPAAPSGQLYDLASELDERKNDWNVQLDLVAELTAEMERIVATHPNDVPVNWRKFLKAAATKPVNQP
jgi:arylsulfatase A-like enzyme